MSMETVVTIAQAAQVAGCTPARIRYVLARDGIPEAGRAGHVRLIEKRFLARLVNAAQESRPRGRRPRVQEGAA